MICCVIGGAVIALVLARLSRLPFIGPYIRRSQRLAADPSNWRLHREEERI